MRESFYAGLLKHGSLEVAAGAVLMSSVLARIYDVEVGFAVYVAQFSAVWFIYLLDRLFDAKKIRYPAANPRHLFYQQHPQSLLFCLCVAGLLGIISVPFLPVVVLTGGFLLIGLCLLYLLLVFLSEKSLPKELLVAMLYTSGISLAPRVLYSEPLGMSDVIIFPAIFIIAFINLIMFSQFERHYDAEDGQSSFVGSWSAESIHLLLTSAFALEFSLIIFMQFFHQMKEIAYLQVLLLAMGLILYLLHRKMHHFANPVAFRLIADGVFLLPLLLFLIK